MIETERNKKKTDQAWNALYQRLDEEGLLSGRPASPFRSILWKGGMAAAVALLCLLVSVVYLNRTEREADRNLLTRQNSETTTTLVTTLEDGSVVYLAGKHLVAISPTFLFRPAGSELTGKCLVRRGGQPRTPLRDRNGRYPHRGLRHGF